MSAEPGPVSPLRIAYRRGRFRAWRHAALLPLTVGAAGFWLGLAGAVPMLVWWWRQRPGPAEPGAWLLVDPAAVRGYRFGRWCTCLELSGPGAGWFGRRLEIFHDELAGPDLARLRRAVKAR